MNKTIMICLESMNIGGVETFVINQVSAYRKKGYNVIVLAKKGIYSEKIIEKGAIFVDFEFDQNLNYYDFKKSQKILDLFKKYEVTEVHINQFPVILSMLPACLLASIPYVLYFHMGINYIKDDDLNVFDYYENNFKIYKTAFKLLFKYIDKAIFSTDVVKKYVQNRYNIANNKTMIISNGIDFDEYITTRQITNISKFLIISRISKEKEKSILNAIDLYVEICKNSLNSYTLDIVGDGESIENIKKYVNNNYEKYNINFLGLSNNIPKLLDKYDLVIGQGRCIIEAIAMKKVAVISGNSSLKSLVKNENIEENMKRNFTGANLSDASCKEIADEISRLTSKKITDMVNENYMFIKDRLSIYNSIYTVNNSSKDVFDRNLALDMMLSSQDRIDEYIDKYNKLLNDHVEYKEYIENINKNLKIENLNLRNEITTIYSSKSYKFISKIKRIIKKMRSIYD